ncbi:MAG: cyclic nucleotide-binding domain-containing protein [Limnospira sp.]
MNKALVILGELTNRDLDWMLRNGERKKLESGMILIEEGQPIDALYIVLKGTFFASVAALGNRQVAKLNRGEVLGEMSFVDGRLPSATVTAAEPSLVLSVPRQKLSDKLEVDALFSLRFYRAVSKFLSSRLRNTVTQFGDRPPSQEIPSPEELDQQGREKVERFEEIMKRLQGEYHVKT